MNDISLIFSILALLASIVGGGIIKVAFSRMFKSTDETLISIKHQLRCLDTKLRTVEIELAKVVTCVDLLDEVKSTSESNATLKSVLGQLEQVATILKTVEHRVNKKLQSFEDMLNMEE
jgi:hypothetical protein